MIDRKGRGSVWSMALLMLLMAGLWACGGRQTSQTAEDDVVASAYLDQEDSFGLVNVPYRGPSDALVTIVEYSDYQCPYCQRAETVVDQIFEQWGQDVRLFYKDFPLAFHTQAKPAARAARAAREQGVFWPYHDLLFANQSRLNDELYEELAVMLKLDMEQFREAMHPPLADRDGKTAAWEIDSVPTFFINGARIRGAVPVQRFAPLIARERGEMQKLLDQGLSREEALTIRIAHNREEDAQREQVNRRAKQKQNDQVIPIVLDDAVPVMGSKDAPVTLVVYVDYQCPFCANFEKTVQDIMADQELGPHIRLAVRMFPLPFHAQANTAAEAALEAHAQGKFWAYQEQLWAYSSALSKERFVEIAQQVGLDIPRFEKALRDGRHRQRVEDEVIEAQLMGVTGTPTWFVNGHVQRGALAPEDVRRILKDALDEAE